MDKKNTQNRLRDPNLIKEVTCGHIYSGNPLAITIFPRASILPLTKRHCTQMRYTF